MPSAPDLVKLTLESASLSDELTSLIRQEQDLAVLRNRDTGRAGLTIIELDPEPEKGLRKVEAALERDKAEEVFLVSARVDADILMHALRIGVREVFHLPLNREEFRDALHRFKKRQKKRNSAIPEKRGSIVSIAGSKGGVGTTTIAVNLAAALAGQENVSVVLIDMNTVFGEIPMFLDLTPAFHWGDITQNIDRLDGAFLFNILCRHDSGIHVLPPPNYLDQQNSASPRIMQTLLELMRSLFDYIVIDNGQSTDETGMMIYQMSDILLLITIQSLPCLANAGRLYKSFLDFGCIDREGLRVILNRYVKNSQISLSGIKTALETELSSLIPNDYRTTMTAINSGKLLCQVAPRSGIVKSFNTLASDLFPGIDQEPPSSFFSRFRR